MNSWIKCTLADLGTIVTGKTPTTKNPEYWDGNIHFVTPKDIQGLKRIDRTERMITVEGLNKVKGSIIPPRAVCVSCIGNIGYVGMSTQKCVTNQQINSIIVNENNDADFVYYLLKNMWAHFKNLEGQSTTLSILNKTQFSKIEVEVPDIEVQREIASVLSSFDAKIECNQKINDNLEQQAQLLFKSWFVDFEPFNGTMPSDWEVVPFETIVDFQNGYAFKSKELLNEPSSDCYQVFKQGHIARGGGFIPDGTKSWYPKKLASKLEKIVIKKGDILMAMTDMKDNVAILGNTAIMPIENEYIVNQRVGQLRANGYKGITYPFIYLLTNSTDFLIDLRSRANSGVQVNLSSAEIKASQTVLPSEKVNTAFSEITLPMFEAIISNQLENQRLAQLRDTLLPKLMSGELDVSDIEI